MNNPYIDSPEKKTIREHHDKKYLQQFIKDGEFEKYEYFGLPSVEFLDIICWKDLISEAFGCEYDKDNYELMEFKRAKLGINFPLKLENIKIEDKITELATNQNIKSYNLYNLDYCSGLFGGGKFTDDKINNLKNIFIRHGREKKNFVLSLTTNVRDTGKETMDKYIDNFFKEFLKGCTNYTESLLMHKEKQYGRYKIFFLGICYNYSSTFNFKQTVSPIIRYSSGKTNLIHFFQKFIFEKAAVQKQTKMADYKNLANMPIFKFKGNNNPTKQDPIRYPQLK